MKREYKKPQLFAETFQLTEHIGSNCSPFGRSNHGSPASCYFDDGGSNGPVFLENGTSGCTYDPYSGYYTAEQLEEMHEQCYGVFEADMILYGS